MFFRGAELSFEGSGWTTTLVVNDGITEIIADKRGDNEGRWEFRSEKVITSSCLKNNVYEYFVYLK